MQSFIITSKNKKKAQEHALSFCRKNGIDVLDIQINDFEKTVGIDDIRNIQKKLYLRPLKSKSKTIIIQSFAGLTVEAQNALLKVLEEPPNNTIIILISDSLEVFLPTVLSRCYVLAVKESKLETESLNTDQPFDFLNSFSNCGIGEKLKKASDLAKNKEEAILWLEKAILAQRGILIKNLNQTKSAITSNLNILKSLQKTHTLLKNTNVSERLALENLFLSF